MREDRKQLEAAIRRCAEDLTKALDETERIMRLALDTEAQELSCADSRALITRPEARRSLVAAAQVARRPGRVAAALLRAGADQVAGARPLVTQPVLFHDGMCL